MKTYKFIYEDKEGNELETKQVEAQNLKDAKRIAKITLANSMMNDLHKIRVKA